MKNLTGLFDNISGYPGHAHFWERALTRRGFLTTAAGTLGLVLGSRAWMPKLLDAAPQTSGIFPRPIPGGIQPFGPGTEVFHVFLPGPGAEPSTITDFHGFVGVTEITGNVTRRNQRTGATDVLVFDNDMRFMQGHYIGVDGREHNGTFGFF